MVSDISKIDTSKVQALMRSATKFQAHVKSATKFVRSIEQFRRENKVLADLLRDGICEYVARRGWFVAASLNHHQIVALKKAVEEDLEDDIEEFMVKHVRSEISAIAAEAESIWPERVPILTDAFHAHEEQLYTLSIPVMLAQADGMALDALRAHFFTNDPRKIGDVTEELITGKLKDRPLAQAFISLLPLLDLGLRMPTKRRDKLREQNKPISPLNRHGVLHGIDCDYATERNGLRAVALIGCAIWLHRIMEDENTL